MRAVSAFSLSHWAWPVAAIALAGCNFVTPGAKPTQGPNLTVTIFDWGPRTLNTFTGARNNTPTAGFPNYAGLWKEPASATPNFDGEIGVRADDPTGVKSLTISYSFYACGDQGGTWQLIPLTSFNNGATTGQSTFTLNANNNPAPTTLAYPIHITETDLQSVDCGGGKKSSGFGTIFVRVHASNFSTDPKTQTVWGDFDIQMNNGTSLSPPPNPYGG